MRAALTNANKKQQTKTSWSPTETQSTNDEKKIRFKLAG